MGNDFSFNSRADAKAIQAATKQKEEEAQKAEKAADSGPKGAIYQNNHGEWIDAKGKVVGQQVMDREQEAMIAEAELRDQEARAAAGRKGQKNRTGKRKPIEFDDQSFLWDNIDLFLNESKPEQGGFHLYKNFLQIKDDNPLITTNKLNAMGIDAFTHVTTAELSSIVPQIKLYKVLPQEPNIGGKRNRTKIPFPFNDLIT